VQIASGTGTVSVGARLGSYTGGIPAQGYTAEIESNGTVNLWRVDNFTLLGSSTISGFSLGTWYTLALRANGNQISVEVNGSTVIGPVSNTAFTSGNAGVWSYAPTSAGSHRFDNFSVTVLGGGVYRKVKVLAMTDARRRAVVSAPPANTTYRVYYYAGGKPIAMRVLPPNDNTGTLYYLHSDHLGSTSVTTCGNAVAPCSTVGGVFSRQRYYPYGEIRPGGTGTTPTTIGYTGQRREEAGLGSLMYYRARFYSPLLQRFLSGDTVVPGAGEPQALNRYAFVLNNPLRYIDPSGHCGVDVAGGLGELDCTYDDFVNMSLSNRIAWIRALMGQPGLTDWFNNILGVMNGYADLGMGGQPGWGSSWLGLVNAGILHSIHDGYGQSGPNGASFNSTAGGSQLWADFFNSRTAGQSSTLLIGLWGDAEQEGTNYGVAMAEARGMYPNTQEEIFLQVGNRYRDGLLDDDAALFGSATGGWIGAKVCGWVCALMGDMVGGAVGRGVVNEAQDPRSTQWGDDHLMRPITAVMLGPWPSIDTSPISGPSRR
jgi:RHS repeat-associated protein